ncbi:MAG: undecaprenyl/decaprenyl-phosphate alpha-N-acetylglucosaminyl 1-phosphate transferase [Bacteroidales bacterium]|nr:undecaprenyl/decaprenyl-phosphate alpha-N-acetylglucosaminyl 1-phosphate transferase [Bacteroidales bacterium]
MFESISEEYIIGGAFIASLLISLFSIPSIVKVAELKNLFDEPGDRTVHTKSIPTLGGLAIFSGLTVSSLFFSDITEIPELKFIIAGIIILFFIGIKDDILIIAPLTKLLGQILVTFIIVFFTDLQITHLHGFFGITEIPQYISLPLTIFVFLVVINGFNLIDGIDGLSAGIGVVVAGTLGMWFYLTKEYQYAILSASVAGALFGFLRYNVFSKKNKIFMGDTGSLILGLIISVLIIKFNEKNIVHNFDYAKYGAPAISIAILIIPLYDTLRVMFIRFFQRKPIFKPDKQHIHHVFIQLGLSHKQAVLILVLINILFCAAAMYMHNLIGIRRLLLVFLLAAMIIFYVPELIKRIKNK